jgi:hypothetical protein
MKVESYRDLEVWQKAMDLAAAAYRLSDSFPSHRSSGYGRKYNGRPCLYRRISRQGDS